MDVPEDSFKRVTDSMKKACLRVGRSPDSVRLVAVSKNHSAEKVLALARLGQRDFGENYVREWLAKREAVEKLAENSPPPLRWHFIGHLQSNKAKAIVGEIALMETVHSLSLAEKINRLAAQRGVVQKALLEIQIVPESGKTGWTTQNILRSIAPLAALSNVDWQGLMAIPPAPEHPEDSRPHFRKLKYLLDEINQMGVFKRPLNELSMGMSQDFEIAIEEGATMVRVGTALFGPRA